MAKLIDADAACAAVEKIIEHTKVVGELAEGAGFLDATKASRYADARLKEVIDALEALPEAQSSEHWLCGHKLIETGDGVKQYVTVAFAFRCACCGDPGGRRFASMGDDGPTPQWPFSHEECPLCALRALKEL